MPRSWPMSPKKKQNPPRPRAPSTRRRRCHATSWSSSCAARPSGSRRRIGRSPRRLVRWSAALNFGGFLPASAAASPRRTDAYLAALAEDFATAQGAPAPSWASEPGRFLSRIWWPRYPGLWARAIVESPAAFRRRGILTALTAPEDRTGRTRPGHRSLYARRSGHGSVRRTWSQPPPRGNSRPTVRQQSPRPGADRADHQPDCLRAPYRGGRTIDVRNDCWIVRWLLSRSTTPYRAAPKPPQTPRSSQSLFPQLNTPLIHRSDRPRRSSPAHNAEVLAHVAIAAGQTHQVSATVTTDSPLRRA